MYTRFFNLKEKPFSLTPDPKYLFLSANHKETYAQLLYSVQEEVGFVAMIGEVGTGKTTTCRAFLNQLPDNHVLAFIFNPNLDDTELLQSLNKELGIPHSYNSKKELEDELNQYLLKQKSLGKRVLLIIDEAQNLNPTVLEQVRLLSNLETETQKLINIILVGQPELGQVLDSPQLRQLKQRISISCHLYPLSLKETKEYILHRLKMAGGEHVDAFSEASVRQIFRHTKGTPRLINVLCDRALLAAYSAGIWKITPSMIRKCIKEINGNVPHRGRFGRVALGLALSAAMILMGFFGFYYGGLVFEANLQQVSASTELPAAQTIADAGLRVRPGPIAYAMEAPLAGDSHTAGGTVKPLNTYPTMKGPSIKGGFDGSDNQSAEIPAKRDNTDFKNALFQKNSRTVAINVLLDVWGEDLLPGIPEEKAPLNQIFMQRKLELFTGNLTFNMLLAIDHPVMLELRGEDGKTGFLPVVSVLGKDFLTDPSGRNSVEKIWALSRWTGRVYIPWRNFADLPPLLKYGTEGDPVKWLQASLNKLGYSNIRPIGIFGRKTENSVMRFQDSNAIETDGRVGAITKIFLYSRLPEYKTPRLG